MREKHCSFPVLNTAGRCVANCRYNWESQFKTDCIGRTGGHSRGENEIILGQLPTKRSINYETITD